MYIATEGPHDVAFLAELLRPWGLQRLTRLNQVDAFWDRLIPKTFPHGGDLLARVPVPIFFAGHDRLVALDSATGITNLTKRIEENLAVLDANALPAIGVVLDADSQVSPVERFHGLAEKLRKLGLPIPERAGAVSEGDPRSGVFVMPDNASPGTLETLLEECAAENYASLSQSSKSYVDGIDQSVMSAQDLRDLQKPAGRQKAIISAMAAVLRPGRAIQVSLQDNQWVRGAALDLPRILSIREFLAKLLRLEWPPAPLAEGGSDVAVSQAV
ncbi:MAG: hypothetical protein H7138_00135 [Myxococcales bacterium]|nr:hypothetical protein [Myxococcales bacterium]